MGIYLEIVWLQLFSSLWFALLGLLVGFGVIFSYKKKKHLERKNGFLKILTKFYFIYYPFVFLFTFWFAGSLWTTAKLFEKEITKAVVVLENETYPVFIAYMNKEVDTFLAQESLPTNKEIVSIFIEENLDKNSSSIYRYSMEASLTTLLEFMIGEDSEREKRINFLSEGFSTSLLEVGFDFIKEKITAQVNQILMLFLIPIIFGFLIAMFFPTVEIFVSNQMLESEDSV